MLSPVYGDMTGFPPALLTTGTRDLLLSNTVRVHRKLRQAGVVAELHVYEGQSHAHYMRDATAPETREAFEEIAKFFEQAPGEISGRRSDGGVRGRSSNVARTREVRLAVRSARCAISEITSNERLLIRSSAATLDAISSTWRPDFCNS